MNISVFFQVLGAFAVVFSAVIVSVLCGMWLEERIGGWQSGAVVIGAWLIGIAALVASIPGIH